MLGELVPCAGGPALPLLRSKLLVGRHASCDIALAFANVSSRHCELELRDGYWMVRDLGSTNGVRVNGKACESARLLPNDILAIATHRYTVVYVAPPARQEPVTSDSPPAWKGNPVPGDEVKGRPPRENAAAGPALGELVPCGGGQPIRLQKATLVVGRHSSCDIVLPVSVVSSRHCQMEWIKGCWFVRDLGSRHGIRVDGTRCDAQRLPPGSILWIANLRYRVEYTPSSAPSSTPAKGSLFGQGLLEKAGLADWVPEVPPGRRDRVDDPDEPRQRHSLDDD